VNVVVAVGDVVGRILAEAESYIPCHAKRNVVEFVQHLQMAKEPFITTFIHFHERVAGRRGKKK
jgi:hypothetical protein